MKTFDPKKLRKLTINVQEMSRNLIFSRNFTISNPKDRVNYVLLGGPNFRTGGHISCDTGHTLLMHATKSYRFVSEYYVHPVTFQTFSLVSLGKFDVLIVDLRLKVKLFQYIQDIFFWSHGKGMKLCMGERKMFSKTHKTLPCARIASSKMSENIHSKLHVPASFMSQTIRIHILIIK